MDSITQSPDRVAQVLSGSAVQNGAGDSAAADSNPVQVVEQAVTGVSAAEFVYESSRQQHSSVSEGVASAGHPPQVAVDRMDEFVPTSAFDAPGAAPGGCEGETSGGNDIADGSNGYGELADTGAAPSFAAAAPFLGSPMDYQATGSVLNGGGTHAGKRKSCGDGSSEFLEPKRPEGGLNRVPSDLAMVMGLSDGEGAEPVEAPRRQPEAPCDSNIAGILAGVAAAPTVGDVEIVQAGEFTDGVGGGGAEPARPSDADIIAWENQIREDEVRNVPLVGDREPLAALEAEYINGSHVFVSKIRTLQQGYSSIRRTRGDGNCFFRSFIFAYLEHILLSGDLAERDAAVGRLAGLQKGLQEAGFDELVVESPMDMLLSMLRSIGSPTDPLTLDVLESNMRAEDVSNYVVFLLRIITSAEVKRRADFFAPFVLGLADLDVDTFCKRCIDPMGEESDHVQMVALTDALQVPLRVVYLDRSLDFGGGAGALEPQGGGGGGGGGGGRVGSYDAGAASAVAGGSTVATVVSAAPPVLSGVKVDVHDFVPDRFPGSPEPKVHLLYRPGHYDVLYPRSN